MRCSVNEQIVLRIIVLLFYLLISFDAPADPAGPFLSLFFLSFLFHGKNDILAHFLPLNWLTIGNNKALFRDTSKQKLAPHCNCPLTALQSRHTWKSQKAERKWASFSEQTIAIELIKQGQDVPQHNDAG
jgi:hypothetical protein